MTKFVLTIEVEIEELSREQREELQGYVDADVDCDDPEEGLPTAADVSPRDVFEAIEMAVESSDDMWAGSECYCAVASMKLLAAEQPA